MTISRKSLAILTLWVPGIVIAFTWMAWQERLAAESFSRWNQ